MLTKNEYLQQLEKNLSSISVEERTEALQYYSEFFDDSPTTEEETSQTLGSPTYLARQITAEAKVQSVENMPPSPKKGFSAAWAIILAIFAIPIGLPILIALVAVVFSLLIALFAVVFSFFAAAVSFIVAGIFSLVMSFVGMAIHFPTGLVMLGGGLIVLGLGALLFYGIYRLSGLIITGIIALTRKIMGGKKNETIH